MPVAQDAPGTLGSTDSPSSHVARASTTGLYESKGFCDKMTLSFTKAGVCNDQTSADYRSLSSPDFADRLCGGRSKAGWQSRQHSRMA
jgi:hypothetical protein